MNLQRHPDFDGHEKVVSLEDKATGLAAIISIHSVALGPAVGGCRKSTYADPDAALTDALRLSRGMSFKNALAGLPAGGGKAVIYRMDGAIPNDPGWLAFGDAVDALSGNYITAEDVGTTVANMEMVAKRTRYVAGLPCRPGKAGGDPSPWTALGVFVSLQAAMGRALTGTRIAVQGLGAVGSKLCELLHREGAKLIVSDVDPSRTARAHQDFGAEVVPTEGIHSVSADAFSPNALGAILNAETISTLNSSIICGGANNQLASAANGRDLLSRGITYVPDYVARAERRPSNEISDQLARALIDKTAHRRSETARIRMTATGKST